MLGYALSCKRPAKSNKADYALAGVWVEALSEADRNHEQKARALFPEIVMRDHELKTEADAEARMHEVLQELGNIRVEYDKPAVCSNYT